MGVQNNSFYFLIIVFLVSQTGQSSGFWPFSSGENPTETPSNAAISGEVAAEFSMESLGNRKGIQLVENAKNKMSTSNSCWQNAYGNLFSGCSEILAGEEKRSRLAWHLSDCFQKDSGRPGFPYCDLKSSMLQCLTKLDEDSRKIYLEFYLETNSICHQLQTDAFKRQTERLVNELKNSAQFAEDKLDIIEGKAEDLLQSSHHIHESLASIDAQTEQVAKMTKDVEEHVDIVLKHSEAVYEQSKEIAGSQSELKESQAQMKNKLEESMAVLHESYNNVVQEISSLKDEAAEIEKTIGKVGDAMALKMNTLQSKAEDIGTMTGLSLDKQKQLLDGQSVALDGLQFLSKFQSQALEESRGTLQQFAELRSKQEDELLRRQELLQQSHDRLAENSNTILAAQEAFESKQASMFVALDKLFALHNAMLLESRLLKAFIVYTILIFVVYMFTSTKQTYAVRPRLYLGLCATFLIEFAILRYATFNIEHQSWIISLVRSLFVLIASIQLLHAIFTYRDFELENNHMLHKMYEHFMNQFNGSRPREEVLSDTESDMHWSSLVVTELLDDVDKLEDPDYMLPEEIGENSVATTSSTRRYNLRSRCHHP
ncbi:Protein GAMETE EXPRESSED 1 like [Actinidia chinensis var. chinensis]|uniref:Protein GAMETE EXPRESSED 1 like n=1 Tax=Actinidia chinensis var. chinensis TaxID=1590841 RepID=A0A2R6Q1L9_ACTCC|nr:Protein GAMETE EXPRESSED 1 like [Actinidia chinensis var. chinensis]